MKEAANPTDSSWSKAKILARYLEGRPRSAQKLDAQGDFEALVRDPRDNADPTLQAKEQQRSDRDVESEPHIGNVSELWLQQLVIQLE